jgi:ADP-heptose:LPS heptosyltransferase
VGSCFWLGVHAPAPEGIADLNVRDMREVMGWLDHADSIVTVDTGPMHIALAMGIPTFVIYQSIDPRMTFEGAQNLTLIQSKLECLGCCKLECPINPKEPPCQAIDSTLIAETVNKFYAPKTDTVL